MTRWLRHKADGTIYEWDKYLDKHPKLEEVSEEVAFPEKFLTPAIKSRVAQFAEEIPAADEVAEIVAALEVEAEDLPPVAKAPRGRRESRTSTARGRPGFPTPPRRSPASSGTASCWPGRGGRR